MLNLRAVHKRGGQLRKIGKFQSGSIKIYHLTCRVLRGGGCLSQLIEVRKGKANGPVFGHLDDETLLAVNRALAGEAAPQPGGDAEAAAAVQRRTARR